MTRRVLHVIPAVAPRYGGPSAAIVGMCRALQVTGCSTLIVATDADGPGRLTVRAGEVQEHCGVPAVFFRRHFGEGFKWSLGMRSWLNAHVNEFDVVHIHAVFSHSSIAAGRACRAAGVPYVVRPLGTLDPWSVGRKRFQKQLLVRAGVGRLLRCAAAMHYTSDDEMRLAETVIPNLPPGLVVPLGVADALFSKTPPSDSPDSPPYVLAIARIDVKKGLDLLIRAFHDLAGEPECRTWQLVIAGDGEKAYVSSLIDLAHQGPARSRIAFRGWVGSNEKAALLRDAGLFALPSRQENFGVSIVEAMASGVPVLTTPGVNLAHAISTVGGGWVVERSQAAVAAALRTILPDSGERRRRGLAARQWAEQYRWPGVADQLIKLYDAVLAQPGRVRAEQPVKAGAAAG